MEPCCRNKSVSAVPNRTDDPLEGISNRLLPEIALSATEHDRAAAVAAPEASDRFPDSSMESKFQHHCISGKSGESEVVLSDSNSDVVPFELSGNNGSVCIGSSGVWGPHPAVVIKADKAIGIAIQRMLFFIL